MLSVCYTRSEIIDCIHGYFDHKEDEPIKYIGSYIQPFDKSLFMKLLGNE